MRLALLTACGLLALSHTPAVACTVAVPPPPPLAGARLTQAIADAEAIVEILALSAHDERANKVSPQVRVVKVHKGNVAAGSTLTLAPYVWTLCSGKTPRIQKGERGMILIRTVQPQIPYDGLLTEAQSRIVIETLSDTGN